MAEGPVPPPGAQKDGTFVGTSKHTKELTVTAAIQDAYATARKDPKYKTGTKSFHVDDIWVVGTNPITEYVVKIRDVPNA
jgi:hypothetical protein